MQLGIIMYWNVAIVMTMTRCTVMNDHDAIKYLSCLISRSDFTPHLGRDNHSFAAYHTLGDPQVEKNFQAQSSAKQRRCWWVSERTNMPYSTMFKLNAVYSNPSPYAIWSTIALQSVLASSCMIHHTVTGRSSRPAKTNIFHLFLSRDFGGAQPVTNASQTDIGYKHRIEYLALWRYYVLHNRAWSLFSTAGTIYASPDLNGIKFRHSTSFIRYS